MANYWGRVLHRASSRTLPSQPKQIVAGVLFWIVSLFILRFILLRDDPESPQVMDEVRWGLSVFGAFVVLVGGAFLVQFVAAFPSLETEAIEAGIAADRIARLDASVRAIDRRMMEGVQLRDRLSRRSAIDHLGEGWAHDLASWQRRCRRTVKHCAPLDYSTFSATVGSDVIFRGPVASSWLPLGAAEEKSRKVIQEWLSALSGVRDALSR